VQLLYIMILSSKELIDVADVTPRQLLQLQILIDHRPRHQRVFRAF